MEKHIEIGFLFETYGKVLTQKQYIVMEAYYNDDLSLSEIGENLNITRQAVRDNIKNAEKKLYELEEKLQVHTKYKQQQDELNKIMKMSEIEEIKKKLQKFLDNL